MLRKTSIIIALIVLVITVSMSGQHFGFERGYDYGVKTFAGIFSSGETAYQYLGECYADITTLLLSFLVGRLIKKEILSQIICISSAVWMLYIYRLIFQQKFAVGKDLEAFYKLLNETISYDWFSVTAISVLLILQIITLSKFAFQKHKAALK
ncbi:MAG TPA: hypothetical protein VGB00_02045 [Pyrinomonadaceae bacterium]